jgi:hypothetical protein
VDYGNFPYIYSVIERQLHIPLTFPKQKVKTSTQPSNSLAAINPSRAYAVLHAQPYDKKTNFSAEEIQQYVNGFRAVPESISIPEMDIRLLLHAQPQAETIVLKALLHTMREEPASDQPYVGQNRLLVRLARALDVFSDRSIREATPDFTALKMTPRQIGSMPNLAAAFGILGQSYKPLLLDILNGYSQRNLSSKTADYHDYFQYHSAVMGLCRLGGDAGDTLPALQTMAETNMLFLEPNKGGITTLIALKRLGANLGDYWPYFAKAGWKRNDFDAFAVITYDGMACQHWSAGGMFFTTVFQKYPQLKSHWPFQTIRENRSF